MMALKYNIQVSKQYAYLQVVFKLYHKQERPYKANNLPKSMQNENSLKRSKEKKSQPLMPKEWSQVKGHATLSWTDFLKSSSPLKLKGNLTQIP